MTRRRGLTDPLRTGPCRGDHNADRTIDRNIDRNTGHPAHCRHRHVVRDPRDGFDVPAGGPQSPPGSR